MSSEKKYYNSKRVTLRLILTYILAAPAFGCAAASGFFAFSYYMLGVNTNVAEGWMFFGFWVGLLFGFIPYKKIVLYFWMPKTYVSDEILDQDEAEKLHIMQKAAKEYHG